MEMEFKKPECPKIDIDGVISKGKQFDLDITLPEAYRKKYYKLIFLYFIFPMNYFYLVLIRIKNKKS